ELSQVSLQTNESKLTVLNWKMWQICSYNDLDFHCQHDSRFLLQQKLFEWTILNIMQTQGGDDLEDGINVNIKWLKLGSDSHPNFPFPMGNFKASDETYENRIRLLGFCQQHNSMMLNTFFDKKNSRRLTLYHPSGEGAMIDLIFLLTPEFLKSRMYEHLK
ncbi:hypothetical protein ACTXT7_016871, partial [Hymenolepis weldensis]